MKILRILSFSERSCICARGIVLSFDIGLWKCSDCVVILEVFRLCGYFGSVPTVWLFWKCSDCVVILEVFRLCGYFLSFVLLLNQCVLYSDIFKSFNRHDSITETNKLHWITVTQLSYHQTCAHKIWSLFSIVHFTIFAETYK